MIAFLLPHNQFNISNQTFDVSKGSDISISDLFPSKNYLFLRAVKKQYII